MKTSRLPILSRPWLTAATFATGVFLTPVLVSAAQITVNTTTDELNADGDCSLREALEAANTDTAVDACAAGAGADVIDLVGGQTYILSLAGAGEDANATGDLDITTDLTIRSTTTTKATVNANGIDRAFHVNSAATATLDTLEIIGGQVYPGNGGGIYSEGTLTLNDTTLQYNSAEGDDGGRSGGGFGGGIYNGGTLTLDGARLFNNEALGGDANPGSGRGSGGGGGAGLGGALFNASGATVTATGSYFNSNTTTGGGGGSAGNCSGFDWYGGNGGGAGGAGGDGGAGGSGSYGGGGGGGDTYSAGGAGGFAGGGGGAGANSGGGSNGNYGLGGFAGGNGGTALYSCPAGGGGGGGLGGAIFDDGGTVTLTDVYLQANEAIRGSAGGGFYGGSQGAPGKGWGGALFTNGGSVDILGRSVISQNNSNAPDNTWADCGWAGDSAIRVAPTVETGATIGCVTTASTQITSVPEGDPNCAPGGLRIDTGVDDGSGAGTRHDGVLEDTEIATTDYVCNGADGLDGNDGASALVSATTLTSGDANCPTGGQQFDIGLDNGDGGEAAADGTLGAGEVDSTSYVCNGANGQDGADGHNSLSRFTALTTGDANCPTGGQMLESGLDNADGGHTADDGLLDAGEVDAVAYICNGLDGADGQDGHNSLVSTTTLAVGDSNCANGGLQFDSGLDNGDGNETAADGTLGTGEVDSTGYVCNGADGVDGADSLTLATPLAVGDANCANGGQQIDFGLDNGDGSETAGDGVLDAGEVDSTAYICNGADGQDGRSTLVEVTEEPAGDNCIDGGQRIDAGFDSDADGTLSTDEVAATSYVCDGADGVDGEDGADGEDAATLLTRTRGFEEGEDECSGFGFMLEVGRDLDADGELSDEEVDSTSPVCNGRQGPTGPEGGCSATGSGSTPGPLAALLLVGFGAVMRRRRRS